MKPGQVLQIELRQAANDKPAAIANVIVDVYFHLNQKQRYGLRAGVTDAQGRLMLTYEDLENSRRRNAELQPWDYKTRIDECDPLLRVVVPSKPDLMRAYEIARSFAGGAVPADAASWLSAANDQVHAPPVTAETVGEQTKILIPVEFTG
jgi:hypothetical protein